MAAPFELAEVMDSVGSTVRHAVDSHGGGAADVTGVAGRRGRVAAVSGGTPAETV